MPKGGNGNGSSNTFPQGQILAVAYTDQNGNGQFDANKDALIAAVVDTNHDKTIDVGDTVVFGTYPLHIDGTAGRGTFTHTPETVTALGAENNANLVEVQTAAGSVEWFHDTVTEFFRTDSTNLIAIFRDGTQSGNDVTDVPLITEGGPGAPDTAANEFTNQPGDQPFLDVFIA